MRLLSSGSAVDSHDVGTMRRAMFRARQKADADRDRDPESEGLDQHDVGEGERAGDDDHDERGRGHDPSASLQPAGHRLGVVAGRVPDLLHPGQQEHLVVHR